MYFRRKVSDAVTFLRSYILNLPARVNATYVSKYSEAPTQWISQDLFNVVRDRMKSDRLEKRSLSDTSMELSSQRIGMPVSVFLEEEPDLANLNEKKIVDYKLTINLDADLRVGIRDLSEFQHFVTLATVTEETVREKCFPGKGPLQQFILCSVRRDYPIKHPKPVDKVDDDLNTKVSIHDGEVDLVCEQPTRAVDALKKYFPL